MLKGALQNENHQQDVPLIKAAHSHGVVEGIVELASEGLHLLPILLDVLLGLGGLLQNIEDLSDGCQHIVRQNPCDAAPHRVIWVR